jgi:flagellar hook assembly protein FlgD
VIYAATRDGLYRLDGSTVAVDAGESRPKPVKLALHQNTPNPFNPATTISFTLSEPGAANLSVYSITGQKIRTLVSEYITFGTYTIVWDGKDDSGNAIASGVYFSRLEARGKVETRRMLLIR